MATLSAKGSIRISPYANNTPLTVPVYYVDGSVVAPQAVALAAVGGNSGQHRADAVGCCAPRLYALVSR